jgi:hypothetical protein
MSNCDPDKSPSSKKLQIAVRVPPGLFNQLKRHIEKTGISQTKVVLNALAEYLGCVEDASITQRLLELEKRVVELESKNQQRQ